MIVQTTLKQFVSDVMSQRQAAKQLNLTPAAISKAISRNDDIRLSYDDKTLSIVECCKISSFGVLQKVD